MELKDKVDIMDSRVKEVKSRKQMEVTEIAGKLGRSGRSNVMSFELFLDTLKKKVNAFLNIFHKIWKFRFCDFIWNYTFTASLSSNNIRFFMLNKLTNFLWKKLKTHTDFFSYCNFVQKIIFKILNWNFVLEIDIKQTPT